jgi:hypothetical protein
MKTNEERLAEALDYLDIRRLQNRYADIVTRRAWAELHEIMRPGCKLELDLGDNQMVFDGPQAIGDFIGEQLEAFEFFEFVILNTVIEVDVEAGVAGGRMYMQELRQNVSDGRRTNAYGVYHDRFERHDGTWSPAVATARSPAPSRRGRNTNRSSSPFPCTTSARCNQKPAVPRPSAQKFPPSELVYEWCILCVWRVQTLI